MKNSVFLHAISGREICTIFLGLKNEPYNKQKLNLTTNLSFLFLTNFGVLKSSK
ncbi:hypothetical protein HMPREF0204_14225 [Chryseobacterium gleum ATCC 35910]|uniref:Uncharacterized protein n=1 Tax=Chryseobacterium gleum ATCC 35910 TaxID=525257 RepID=A0ABP2INI3_CHRGE|nr:hypothetical protein HMPREF0204_14225 [Chryseobacterium gleum ATCC 35910]